MTRLSGHRFRSNEVRLWLSLIAYNLGNLWRRLVRQEDRRLVVHQLAAAAGENRPSSGQACPLLLVAPGRESSYEKVVWGDAPTDRSTARAQRLEGTVRIRINPNKSRRNGRGGRRICEGFPDKRAQPVLERESRGSRGRGCTKPSGC